MYKNFMLNDCKFTTYTNDGEKLNLPPTDRHQL